MTISKDLFLSILSMDAYNRGYHPGIEGLANAPGTRIGSATILDVDIPIGSELASFYAISYTIGAGVDDITNGTTVISYRGTDEPLKELTQVDFNISYWSSFKQQQIALASKFFDAVDAADGAHPIH